MEAIAINPVNRARRTISIYFSDSQVDVHFHPLISPSTSAFANDIQVEYLVPEPDLTIAAAFTNTVHHYSPSRSKQFRDIALLQQYASFEPGDVLFLVAKTWWDAWVTSLTATDLDGGDSSRNSSPGPIDNWSIIDKDIELNPPLLRFPLPNAKRTYNNRQYYRCRYNLVTNCRVNQHFVAVQTEAWLALYQWFGGGPPLPRIVSIGNSNAFRTHADGTKYSDLLDKVSKSDVYRGLALKVNSEEFGMELYPDQPLSLLEAINQHATSLNEMWSEDVEKDISTSGERSGALAGKRIRTHGIDGSEINERTVLHFRSMNFNDCGKSIWSNSLPNVGDLSDSQTDVAKAANSCFVCRRIATFRCSKCCAVYYCDRLCQEGHWPFHKRWCSRAAELVAFNSSQFHLRVNVRGRGNVGLHNLGNSCYMNSSLQCLSHIIPLTTFFLSNRFRNEINHKSLDGTSGKLANEYASLLHTLWLDQKTSISPTRVKHQLGKIRPEFAGFQQHDAHELIELLLDKLHEDLNRVQKKPYTENPEGDGTNDEKIAAEAWTKHSLRENSIIKDILGSQMRSQLTCLECGRVSVGFDYQQIIPLPIPSDTTRIVRVLFVPQASILARSLLSLPCSEPSASSESNSLFSRRRESLRPVLLGVVLDKLSPLQALKAAVSLRIRNIALNSCNGSEEEDGTMQVNDPARSTSRRRSRSGSISVESRYQISSLCLLELGGPQLATVTKILKDDDSLSKLSEGSTVLCYAPVEKMNAVVFMLQRKIWSYSATAIKSHVDYDVVVPNTSKPSLHHELSGIPILLSLDMKWSCLRLRMLVWQQLSRFIIDADFERAQASPYQSFPFPHSLRQAVLEAELSGNVAKQIELCKLVPIRLVNGVGEGVHSVLEGPVEHCSGYGVRSDGNLGSHADSFLGSSVPFDNSVTIGDFLELTISSKRVSPIRFVSVDWSGSWLEAVVPESTYLSVHPSSEVLRGFPTMLAPFTITDLHALNYTSKFDAVRPRGRQHTASNLSSGANNEHITLEQCLSAYSREEVLDDSNAWYCGVCKKHQRARKNTKLWSPSLPEVIIFVLKRFEFRDVSTLLGQTGGAFIHREKISTLVDFPINGLDLTPYCVGASSSNDKIYDLFAVCNHFGRLGSGHYTAFARDWCGSSLAEAWFSFDDDEVTALTDESEVVTEAAYILFYRRRPSPSAKY